MFEFTEADLRSNQNGFISASQKESIDGMAVGIRATQRSTAKIAIVFPFLGLCMILALFLSNEDSRAALFSNPLNIVILILLVPFVVGIFLASIYFADRRADRLSEAGLRKVEGAVELEETHSSKTGPAYYVILGKERFFVPEELFETFQEGARYRFYYCEIPMLKFVLSYEKL
jgi:hypothetical protein